MRVIMDLVLVLLIIGIVYTNVVLKRTNPQLYSISKSRIRKSHLIKTILLLIKIYIHCDIKKEQETFLK
jgi:hypothetical protein